MTTKIFSSHCARSDFIDYQYRSLKSFFTDEHELIILNDAKDPVVRAAISSECVRLNLACYETPDDLIHSSGPVACASVLQWAWDELVIKKYSDASIVFLDSDMFMVRDFSAKDFLGDAVIAGVPQRRGKIAYFWNGVMLFDVPRMPNPERIMLYCGIVHGQNVDVGGMIYYYFMENPQIGIRAIPHTSHIHSSNSNMHILPEQVLARYDENYRIEICASSFLHYGSGTNWKVAPGHEFVVSGDSAPPKTTFVFWLLDSCIDGDITMPEISFVFQGD